MAGNAGLSAARDGEVPASDRRRDQPLVAEDAKRPVGGAVAHSWDYVNISGVEVHKGITTLAIVLQVQGVTPVTKFGRLDKGPASVWEAPNALMTSAKGAEGVVGTIRKRIAESQQSAAAPAGRADAVAQLTQLAELRERGVLSDDEFQTMKARIVTGH